MNTKKILIISVLTLFAGFQLSAQMIPEIYFKPKPGGTPKSDFYTLVSYDIGMVYASRGGNISESAIGSEALNFKFFFPSNSKKGYTIDFNVGKSIQSVNLFDFGVEEIFGVDPDRPILSNNIELKAKSISNSQWGWGLIYQRRKYEAGNIEGVDSEEYSFNGIGMEFSVGGYPDLNYKKGNWPVSFTVGAILQTESFQQDGPGGLFYGILALERIRKKQGVSFYGSVYTKVQADRYYYVPDWAENFMGDSSEPKIAFELLYFIPGFKFGVLF
jgi:hypothetical protein